MKKVISIFLVMCFVLTFGCSNVDTNSEVASQKKLIVGFDAGYPPFGYLAEDGKTYTGFDLELAKEVCSRIGYEYIPQPIDWVVKDMELNSGTIDCIWNGFTIDGRENNYEWSVPYIDNSIVFIVRNDSDIENISDLAGKIALVQTASSGYISITSEENKNILNSFKELQQCTDYNTAFMNLESGTVDVVIVDIGVAKYNLKQKNGIFKELNEKLSSEKYGIGFRKGNTALRDLVQNALFEMYKDGTFMNIANKYAEFSLPETVCIGDYID